MSNDELARRAVASKRFQWMVGMVNTRGDRVLAVQPFPSMGHVRITAREAGPYGGRVEWYCTDAGEQPNDVLPDLSDPATLGCLLALVREAWGDDLLHCAPSSQWLRGEETWIVWRFTTKATGWQHECRAYTEAGALVAALEAAP